MPFYEVKNRVACSTPVTSSKKSCDIPLKSGVYRGTFAFMRTPYGKVCRKIMLSGGPEGLNFAQQTVIINSSKQ